MVDVGIAHIDDGEFVPLLAGNIDEIGPIVKVPAETDADGNIVTPAVVIAGHHVNVRFAGESADALTDGLPQTDAEGNLLPLMQRTWAAYVFGLVETAAIDPTSGFPFQATTEAGDIQYGDPADLSSPSNVRQ